MVDIRKIIIIFVVAILFAVLVFSVIEAVYPQPKYEDFCKDQFYPRSAPIVKEPTNCPDLNVTQIEIDQCVEIKGNIDYTYDSKGCAINYECNTCNNEMTLAQQKHDKYVFYISAILSLIAVFIGLYLPANGNTLNEWIGTGFMLGGTFALFFGTATSFNSLERYIRPIVIFLELGLILFIAYRKIGNLKEDKKQPEKT